nr:wall-associated receptor kinase 2-like [Tanacetum cinerariifolium]
MYSIAKPNCQTHCGNITVPYTFGIGQGTGCVTFNKCLACPIPKEYGTVMLPQCVWQFGFVMLYILHECKKNSHCDNLDATKGYVGNPYLDSGCLGAVLGIVGILSLVIIMFKLIQKIVELVSQPQPQIAFQLKRASLPQSAKTEKNYLEGV